MKNISLKMLSAVALFGTSLTANAGVIDFEDLAHGTIVTNQYAAQGATFTPTHFSVIGGLAEGDPGNWDLQGTNGSHFLGYNGTPSYFQTIDWDVDITNFSLDVSRSNGSPSGLSFKLIGTFDGAVVDEVTVALSDVNFWTNVSLTGVFDRILWGTSNSAFHPYGVDNIVFEYAPVPEPSTLGLVALGLLGLGFRNRRRPG